MLSGRSKVCCIDEAGTHQRELLERLGEVLGQEADRDHGSEHGREHDGDRRGGVPHDRTDAEREEREQAEVGPAQDHRTERVAVGERDGRVATLVVEPALAQEPLADLEAGGARRQPD